MKHSFQEVEETANERLKEELTIALIQDLKLARQAEGVLTLADIARAIQEGVGEDDAVLAGLLMVISNKAKPKKSIFDVMEKQNEVFFKQLNEAFGK